MQNIHQSLTMNKMETKPFVANYFNADSVRECLANTDIQVNYDFKAKALNPERFFEKMNQDIQNQNEMTAWVYIRMDDRKVKVGSKNRKLEGEDPTPVPVPNPTLQVVNCGPGTISGILVFLFIFFFMWMYMMAVDGLSGPVEFNKNLLKVGKEF